MYSCFVTAKIVVELSWKEHFLFCNMLPSVCSSIVFFSKRMLEHLYKKYIFVILFLHNICFMIWNSDWRVTYSTLSKLVQENNSHQILWSKREKNTGLIHHPTARNLGFLLEPICGGLQWCLFFWKFLPSPYMISTKSDNQLLSHHSKQHYSPLITQFGQEVSSSQKSGSGS